MPARVSTTRNVVLGDYHGGVLAGLFLHSPVGHQHCANLSSTGFHQYGSVSWKTFFSWLELLFDTTDPWIIVGGDRFAPVQYLPTDAFVASGKYVLLAAGRSFLGRSPQVHKLTPVFRPHTAAHQARRCSRAPPARRDRARPEGRDEPAARARPRPQVHVHRHGDVLVASAGCARLLELAPQPGAHRVRSPQVASRARDSGFSSLGPGSASDSDSDAELRWRLPFSRASICCLALDVRS